MNRSLLILLLLLLLLGGLGYWQREKLGSFMAGFGLGRSAAGASGNAAGGGKKPAAPPPEIEGVRVIGIVNSTRSSAVLDVYGKLYTVMVGDEFPLALARNAEPQRVRCEEISGLVVTLFFPANSNRVQLALSK
jgi:hypothetical protein